MRPEIGPTYSVDDNGAGSGASHALSFGIGQEILGGLCDRLRHRLRLVLQVHARDLPATRFVHQEQEFVCGNGVTQALFAYIRDAISGFVGKAAARVERHVDAEAIG
jgi:hypothetical protein